ncbi:MAG: FAD-dependent oxidoreductase, partial [Anaerolineae bacterium]
GGMTAASLLAKRGLSVLMIDQQAKPGGSCTSFRRDGITYDVGTAMLYGFGETGFKPFRFIMNELEEPVEVLQQRPLLRMTFAGHPIILWSDVERYLQELDPLFPDEHDGLRAFYRDLYDLYEHIVIKNEVIVPPSEYSPRQGLRSLLSGPLKMLRMQRPLTTPTRALLDKYFTGDAVVDYFDKLCSAYCYCTADEMPAVLAATMFLDNHIGGAYYPAGGAQMLPNKIEKAFERDGGQVLYQALVDEILIKDGAAYGVRLRDGTELHAERIIANATVWNLYGKLVRPEHITPERLAWAQSLIPTFPSMTLYLLVDRSALPADAMPWEVFIENRAEIDSTDLTLYINSLVDESLAPRDQVAFMAISPNLEAWPAPGSPEDGSAAYRALKQAAAERMLAQIEAHWPGFKAGIRECIAGTPTTIERYLLKNRGAVGGPKNMIGQEMLKRLHARSEWRNLYLCGDSTVMGTGAPATAVSGVGAANLVLRDLKMREYDARRHARQYVDILQAPYRRPTLAEDEPLTLDNAWLAAAQCQGCERPGCVAACPAGIDIPGIMRRLEAGNLTGAARELHRRMPFAGLCGIDCPSQDLCEQRCTRTSFAGAPVRIAELLRLVNAVAGADGWLQPEGSRGDWRVAVLGANLAGLTCAYYLALAGAAVDVLEGEAEPGLPDGTLGDLQHVLAAGPRLVLAAGPRDLQALAGRCDAVFVARSGGLVDAQALLRPGGLVTAGGQEGPRLAGQVAAGRRAAFAISESLSVRVP